MRRPLISNTNSHPLTEGSTGRGGVEARKSLQKAEPPSLASGARSPFGMALNWGPVVAAALNLDARPAYPTATEFGRPA